MPLRLVILAAALLLVPAGTASARLVSDYQDVLTFTAVSTTYGGQSGPFTLSTNNPGGSCVSARYGSCSITFAYDSVGCCWAGDGVVPVSETETNTVYAGSSITYGDINLTRTVTGRVFQAARVRGASCGGGAFVYCGPLAAEGLEWIPDGWWVLGAGSVSLTDWAHDTTTLRAMKGSVALGVPYLPCGVTAQCG